MGELLPSTPDNWSEYQDSQAQQAAIMTRYPLMLCWADLTDSLQMGVHWDSTDHGISSWMGRGRRSEGS